jgi:hypothetical protein
VHFLNATALFIFYLIINAQKIIYACLTTLYYSSNKEQSGVIGIATMLQTGHCRFFPGVKRPGREVN